MNFLKCSLSCLIKEKSNFFFCKLKVLTHMRTSFIVKKNSSDEKKKMQKKQCVIL